MEVSAFGQTFYRPNRLAKNIDNPHGAGTHWHIVYMYRAGTTLSNTTTELGTDETEYIAQDPQQRHVRFDIDLVIFTVYVDCVFAHDPSLVPNERMTLSHFKASRHTSTRNRRFSGKVDKRQKEMDMAARLLSAMTLILLIFTLSASGEIYRWVDKNGNVHFSDTKPENRKSEQIVVDAPGIPAVPDEGELRRLDLLKQAQEAWERKAKLENSVSFPDVDEHRIKACRHARINYGVLTEKMPVYQTEDGNYRPKWHGDTYRRKRNYVADDVRSTVLASVQADIYEYCNDPDNYEVLTDEYNLWIDSEYCAVARVKLESANNERSRAPRSEMERWQQEVRELCNYEF